MPDDRPNATELIETVDEFLRERALPALSGHMAFQVRIAASLLAIARRELELGPQMTEDARTRLRDLLGTDASLEELEAELVSVIRDSDGGGRRDEIYRHLRQTAEDKLRVANPKYLGPRSSARQRQAR